MQLQRNYSTVAVAFGRQLWDAQGTVVARLPTSSIAILRNRKLVTDRRLMITTDLAMRAVCGRKHSRDRSIQADSSKALRETS